jgi:3-phenylpropionate/cinnamic acid dioxygenase small subunit
MEPTYASVARLVFRYAEYLDDGDLEGMASMFANATLRTTTPDGVYAFTGSEQVLGAFTGSVLRYEQGTLGTKHVTTNLIVDDGPADGTATARSYFTVLQARPAFPLQVVCAGRYRDSFVRDSDGWRFEDRLIRIELVGDMSHHVAAQSTDS